MVLFEEDNGSCAVALIKDDDLSWALFPHFLTRVALFSERYDSDADVGVLQERLQQTFAHPNPGALMLVYLDDCKDQIVGHCLATMEEWFGTKMVTVVQYELDKPASREMIERSLAYIEGWGRHWGADFMQVLAINDKVARIYSTYNGFRRERILMRKSLRPSTGTVLDHKVEENGKDSER